MLPVHHGVTCSLSCEEPRKLSLPVEKQLCPAIQKLMLRSPGLHPLSQHPEQRPCESGSPSSAGGILPGPVQLGSPWNGRAAHCTQNTCRGHKLLEQLQGAPGAVHKYNPCAPTGPAVATQVAPGQSVAQSQLVYFSGPLPPPTPGHQALRKEQGALSAHSVSLSGSQESSPTVLPTQELLRKLQVVHQEQQAAPRPALAARFPVSAQGSGTEKPLEAWVSKTANMENQAPLLQVNMYWERAALGLQWDLQLAAGLQGTCITWVPIRTATRSPWGLWLSPYLFASIETLLCAYSLPPASLPFRGSLFEELTFHKA